MANIESNTLLEKLTSINHIKSQIKQTLIDIGAEDYIDNSTPFSKYPNVITSIHTEIHDVCSLLEYTIYGGEIESSLMDKETIKYIDTVPYLLKLQECRQTLIDNLRLKNIECSDNEPLDSLINKILRIE